MQNFWHQMNIAWHKYSLFWEMWQHLKTAQQIYYSYCYVLTMPSETIWKKVTNSAKFSCSPRYCVTPVSSFLGYSMSDFHCSPSANITSGSPISSMDGNSSNLFRILWYSSVVVVILFPLETIVFALICRLMHLISYAQDIASCQRLAWLSSVFKM